jgi:large subunit ribosomal protein L10
MAHVSESKKQKVKELADAINSYSVIGIVNMENLPAKQLQLMRRDLRGIVLITMSKKTIIKKAFEGVKKENIQKLSDYLVGMPAIILTNENPFKLFKTLKKSKSKAPIKVGQVAPKDIVVTKGPTSFAPGPIIGELGALKIKAGIEGGKVSIKQDAVVAKKGEVVIGGLAAVLMRLGIEPMEIGLDLVAVYEKGELLTKDVLDIDDEVIKQNIKTAYMNSFAVALEIGYACNETVVFMIQKAFMEAKCISDKSGYKSSIVTIKEPDNKEKKEAIAEKKDYNAEKKAVNIEKKEANIEKKDDNKKYDKNKDHKKSEDKKTEETNTKNDETKADEKKEQTEHKKEKTDDKKNSGIEQNPIDMAFEGHHVYNRSEMKAAEDFVKKLQKGEMPR